MVRLPWPVVLASASPRRIDLLATLVESYLVVPANIDEDLLTVEDPCLTAQKLATAKASAVALLHPDSLVIGCDTVVATPRGQLAKPISKEDACNMLRQLSGMSHSVMTGVCLSMPSGDQTKFVEVTVVSFKELSDKEIRKYVATGEPMDKAGGYAIQGGASAFVTSLSGSLSNVVGLPVERLDQELQALSAKIAGS